MLKNSYNIFKLLNFIFLYYFILIFKYKKKNRKNFLKNREKCSNFKTKSFSKRIL